MTTRERPILFNSPMVRAILDGRKTQTRRVVKGVALDWLRPSGFTPEFVASPENGLCPYGQPGDRLWVRETFIERSGDLFYRADGESRSESAYIVCFGERIRRWTPSIHMPRWASRITLEITDVRVQRVQDISETDAIAEGISRHADGYGWHTEDGRNYFPTPGMSFASLWYDTYGPDAWDRNDWVWAVSFKRIEVKPHA